MDLKDNKKLQLLEIGRRRGWVINFLYESRPNPLSFNMLWQLLDARNMPLTCRQFSEKLDYLRSKGYIRVFKMGDAQALSTPEQAQLIQAFCDMDGEGGDRYSVSLSTAGVDFHEGVFEDPAVIRVN
jgi:hypothetical protein